MKAVTLCVAYAANFIFVAFAVPSTTETRLLGNMGQRRNMAVESSGAVSPSDGMKVNGSSGAEEHTSEATKPQLMRSKTAQPAAPQDPAGSCELPNGFAYEECGSGDLRACCAPEQQCISAKPKEGDELFACSASRKLVGSKAVKVVVTPLLMGIAFICVAAYMLIVGVRTTGLGEPMIWLLVTQVVLSLFLLFSPAWTFGFYTVVLGSFVHTAWKSNDLLWWVYRLALLLQVFHIIAIFGPFETFHVPFGGQSTFSNSDLANNAASLTGNVGVCSDYYGGYFTLLPIERGVENVNPNHTTFGYCTETWLGFVQATIVILGMLQAAIVFRTVHLFFSCRDASESNACAKN
jgi:hypothetical protein